MKKEQQLFNCPISTCSFNGDNTKLVISDNTQLAYIYSKDASGNYVLESTLKQHIERITSVDWAPKTNRIVTCAGDRNAYVWNYNSETGEWKPSIVLLRINRAATCVTWSPLEDRFAVGSGARLLSLCYFEEDHDWWVSKHIKKPIRSTILCAAFHPNNMVVAIGTCDFKCRVYSAVMAKELGDKPEKGGWLSSPKFGVLLAEFGDSTGWVHCVKFSPSGDYLAWVAHDSSVNVVNVNSMDKVISKLSNTLPLMSFVWGSESSIIGGGFDNYPVLYNVTSDDVVFAAKLDTGKDKSTGAMSAMARFKQLDSRGNEGSGTKLNTTHQNNIKEVRVCERDGLNKVTTFATSGADGKLVLWNVDQLTVSIGGCKL